MTYLAGIEKHWIGFLLSLAGKMLLLLIAGLCTAACIATGMPMILNRLG